MSDAYERERQNNSRLSELSAKVTALRGVTVDIYDNARAQDVIDNTVCEDSPFDRHVGFANVGCTVGYLLLDEHLLKGVREPVGTYGCIREQGCNLQAGRYNHWSRDITLVYMGAICLRILRSIGKQNGLVVDILSEGRYLLYRDIHTPA